MKNEKLGLGRLGGGIGLGWSSTVLSISLLIGNATDEVGTLLLLILLLFEGGGKKGNVVAPLLLFVGGKNGLGAEDGKKGRLVVGGTGFCGSGAGTKLSGGLAWKLSPDRHKPGFPPLSAQDVPVGHLEQAEPVS